VPTVAAKTSERNGGIGMKIKKAPSVVIPDKMLAVARNVEVKIDNLEKKISYKRPLDITQWYCRVLNFSVNPNVRGGWRIRSLSLGLEDMELLEEADNFVDLILLLDFFDKGPARDVELSFFADGWWPKKATYLPRDEVIYQYPADGFFKSYTPFTL
jgi:hypothetical protein